MQLFLFRLRGCLVQCSMNTGFYLLFLLLVGLQHLKQLNMNSCRYVTDMKKLLTVKETLEQLDIGNCGGISDLTPLHELTLVSIIILNLLTLCTSGLIHSLTIRNHTCSIILREIGTSHPLI